MVLPFGDAVGGHGAPGVGLVPGLLGDPLLLSGVEGNELELDDPVLGVEPGDPFADPGTVLQGDVPEVVEGFGFVVDCVVEPVAFGVPDGEVDPGVFGAVCGVADPAGGVAVPAGGVAVPAGGVAGLAGGVAGLAGGVTVPVGGVAVPAGGVAVPAGGVAVPAGGVAGEPGVEVCPAVPGPPGAPPGGVV